MIETNGLWGNLGCSEGYSLQVRVTRMWLVLFHVLHALNTCDVWQSTIFQRRGDAWKCKVSAQRQIISSAKEREASSIEFKQDKE